jgi:short-subunit dehydrogenase
VRPPIDGGIVLITGVSSGIGKEMARQLAPRAKTLIIVARRKDRLEEIKAELVKANPSLQVDVEALDLSDLEATEEVTRRVLAKHGTVDVLINNAGFGDVGLYEFADWEKMLRMIRVNVEAVALLTHRLLPGMLKQRKGGILNVSSGWGLSFMPGFATYVGTKQFVTGFTECLRLEAKSMGVVVTQVCPGPVSTEFVEVSGNPFATDVPGIISLTPERCAKIAIAGFDRGRALVVPGFIMSLLVRSGMYTPRSLLRLLFSPVAPLFRKRQSTT